jgi:bifunctional non-homologous end joining protein LigD
VTAPGAGPGREAEAEVEVEVEGRRVRLTNLGKVLWPSVGMTKGALVDHYVQVAPVLLPHLDGHPVTLHRFPDGVAGPHWYATRAPSHPPWVRTQEMYVFRSGKDVRAAVIDGLPALMWAANTGAVELHPYLGTTADLRRPTVAVFDLDPGPPATVIDAARVALALHRLLDGLGLASFPKTSGARGLHVHVPLNAPHDFDDTKAFARAVARHLTERHPAGVVDVMARARRQGKVFVDWSQNDAGKSTIAPYSLRGLWYPTAAAPVTWEEVETAASTGEVGTLVFLARDVLARLDRMGDLFAPVLHLTQSLPAA